MSIINKGFGAKHGENDRLPPGQYLTEDFPVLAFGPTPRVDRDEWVLEVSGLVDQPQKWGWTEINALPQVNVVTDIHCVTKWSKFDTKWRGVNFEDLMKLVGAQPGATHIVASSADGYTTNLPIADLINGQAMVALSYDDKDIEAVHGGPARLLVPHLYFWKSAKWLTKIEFVDHDVPGFWETKGYHNYGDPWKEQRYDFDE